MSQDPPHPSAITPTYRISAASLKPSLWLAAFCLACLLTACSGSRSTPYLPPTASGEAILVLPTAMQTTPASQAELPISTATPICTNNLIYLADLTLPDGSPVIAGSTLDKRWRAQNNGSCNWDERYRVKLISGPELGAREQALFPARSGTELTIQIIFTAPDEPGTYQSAWQAHDPQGIPFGDPFYIDFVVENP